MEQTKYKEAKIRNTRKATSARLRKTTKKKKERNRVYGNFHFSVLRFTALIALKNIKNPCQNGLCLSNYHFP